MAVLASNYPTSLDTTTTLGEVSNRAKTTLAVALADTGETQISLGDGSLFPNSGAVTIDNEIFYYSSKATNVLTIESRARQSTTAAAHSGGALVYLRMTKGHYEVLKTSLIATQTKLGIDASTPSASTWLKGTGSGTSSWTVITKTDVGLSAVENTALSTWAGTTNITTLGTIGTGLWQGSVISSTYGGMGVNNSGRTLTISTNSGTLAFSGAGTTMTFPSTTATLARTDSAQTFTGVQTFSSTIVGSISGNAATVTTNANLTGDVTSSGNVTTIASQNSAFWVGKVSDETGSGLWVFNNTPTLIAPLLGTPTSGNLSNCTALPISTGVSGLASGIATFLATPSSANLLAAVTNETGTGNLVFSTNPAIVTPTIYYSAYITGNTNTDSTSLVGLTLAASQTADVSNDYWTPAMLFSGSSYNSNTASPDYVDFVVEVQTLTHLSAFHNVGNLVISAGNNNSIPGNSVVVPVLTVSSLGSVTANEFVGAFTGNASTATALQNARTIGGVSFNGTANITVATATGGFTISGGNLALSTNSITMTGSLAATGARVTKGWFTDVESTNMYTVGGTSLSSTFSAIAGSASIVTVGTITTGTWNASVINSTYGGMGVNNAGRTLTLNTNSGTIAFGAASKTLTINNSVGITGTDGTTMTFPAATTTVAGLGTTQTFTGINTFTPTARSSGVTPYHTVNAPADTNLTASTEAIGISYVGAVRQHATGALTLQREHVFAAPTYSFVGSSTLTTAVTVDIAEPVAGTNATITNKWALRSGATLIQTTTATQLQVGYDASNYYTTAVSSAGRVTFDAVGASAGFAFSDHIYMGNTKQINWGTSYGQAALYLYDAGASNRWGWGLNAGEMQFFGTSDGTQHISFNGGGDFQSSGTNEVGRIYFSTGDVGFGTGATVSARMHLVKTTEQLRIGYDVSNYYKTTVGSTGGVTFDAVGSGAGFTFSDPISSTRINQRVTTDTSSSTPTPAGDTSDMYTVTALAAGATFAAPTGTPVNGQKLLIRIKDNGTARTLAWNAIYRAVGVTLPTTTVISKTLYVGMVYNSADTKWDVTAVGQE